MAPHSASAKPIVDPRCPAPPVTNAVLPFKSNNSEIDSYDTVFRLGMVPLSNFRNEAGLKSNFVYIRDRKLRRSKGNFVDECID